MVDILGGLGPAEVGCSFKGSDRVPLKGGSGSFWVDIRQQDASSVISTGCL